MIPEEFIEGAEKSMVKSVLESAYDAHYGSIEEFIIHWRVKKEDLLELMGGKLRVVADIEDESQEESCEKDSFDMDTLLNQAERYFEDFYVTFNSDEVAGKAIDSLINMYAEHMSRASSVVTFTDWMDADERLEFDREKEKVVMIRTYRIKMFKFVVSLCKSLDKDDLKNNRMPGGMKINKYIKSMFPSKYHQDIDDKWSMLIQSIKPIKSANDIVISIAPIDYLLHSEANDWGSCHSMKSEKGSAGLSVGMDSVTLVAYRNKKHNMKDCTRHGLHINFDYPDKSWRQLIHVDLKNGGAVFGKQYPYASNEVARAVRRKVMSLMAEYKGVKPSWKKRNGRSNVSCGPLVYPDLSRSDYGQVCLLKDESGDTIDNGVYARYGADVPCMSCGEVGDWDEEPFCCDCGDNRVCVACGWSGDISSFLPVDGDIYCDDCFSERFTHCEDCGDAVDRDWVVIVELGTYGERLVCEDCITNEYIECYSCSEYYRCVDVQEVVVSPGSTRHCTQHYCWRCVEEYTHTCETCGELCDIEVIKSPAYHPDYAQEFIDRCECEDCRQESIDDITAQNEQEEAI